MEKRINFIDIVRGFAITFIVLGHTITHSEHCDLIYKILCSFHVVLFFILSGYTFKVKKEQSFYNFVKNKFIRIMVPYFVWSVLFLIPYLMFGEQVASDIGAKGNFDVKQQLINIFYGNGNEQALKQNTSLWFLPALFSMEIIYYWIIKFVSQKSNIVKILLLFPLLLIAYIVNMYLDVILPWGINTVLVLGVFFYIGYLFKEFQLFSKEKLFKIYYIFPILILGLLSGILNEKISAVNYKYGYLSLAMISGICLSIIVIYISYLINKNKIIEYIGKNTMDILIFHKLVILIFQTKLGTLSKMMKNSNFFIEMIISVFVVVLSIVCSLIVSKVLNRTIEYLKNIKKEKLEI